jgi:surface antigen
VVGDPAKADGTGDFRSRNNSKTIAMKNSSYRIRIAILIAIVALPEAAFSQTYPNTYPRKDMNPYPTQDIWGFYNRQCTSYCAWKLNEMQGRKSAPWVFTNAQIVRNGITKTGRWGNANEWDDRATALGLVVNTTPAVGAIAHWDKGEGMRYWNSSAQRYEDFGHVAFVERVNSDGTVDVTEYNYSANAFTTRKAQPKRFIHIFAPPNTAPVIANLSATSDYLGNVIVSFNVSDTAGDRVSQADVWVRSGTIAVKGSYVTTTTNPNLGARQMIIPVTQLRGTLFKGASYTAGVRVFDSAGLSSGDKFSGSFVCNMPAAATAPEIGLNISGTQIACTSSQNSAANFASTTVGSEQYNRYTVENTGTGTLTLGALTLSNTTDFSIYSYPASSVAPGQTTTFGIKFRPTSAGTKSCTLSLTNNDSNENPYAFTISGTAQGGATTSATTTNAMERYAAKNTSWLGTFTGTTHRDSTLSYRYYSSGIWLANQTGTNLVYYLWNGTWYSVGNQ